eukprot:29894_1
MAALSDEKEEFKSNAPVMEVMEPDFNVHLMDKYKAIEKATCIVEQSKEPFWGDLIKKLYRAGFTVDQIEEAFKRANQKFKWKGQISIWYQESGPTCSEQLEFANGDGRPTYVKAVIKQLVDDNCKKVFQPIIPQQNEQTEVNQTEVKIDK